MERFKTREYPTQQEGQRVRAGLRNERRSHEQPGALRSINT